jgi:hypothetical protein
MATQKSVEAVLQEVGLHALFDNFKTQRVEFDTLLSLSDTELCRLGVTTIGDRIRLREKVRETQDQVQDNPINR